MSLFQHSYYICVNFNAILYGVELVLYYLTMKRLLVRHGRTGPKPERFPIFSKWYSTASLLLITIYMSTEAVFGEEMWIVNDLFPGGADAWFNINAAVWYQTMGTAAFVVLNFMTDAFMASLWRCFETWKNVEVISPIAIISIPTILYTATWGLGIFELWASGSPGANILEGKARKAGLAYFSTTICLNIIVTALICGRLLFNAKRTYQDSSMRGDASKYTGATHIIIESALPYTMAGIAYLVSTGLNSGISILMGALYGMFACISPQLVILRMRIRHESHESGRTTRSTPIARSTITLPDLGSFCEDISLKELPPAHIV
ncbi:hypothetical protein CERSUDRAFT_77882 [Gelatoporia subvermispora B]|uniref:Uncharacterized protein n=1 Tax=Ceriporiopsis subvermispora (strain B) TaxID=914234 RepID=M2R0M2_CERS8|nr:hypothetical protein CERSUDRAFT_77882 [Gelatoporia subvermispora B]